MEMYGKNGKFRKSEEAKENDRNAFQTGCVQINTSTYQKKLYLNADLT